MPSRPVYDLLSYHRQLAIDLEGKPLSSLWEGKKVMKKPVFVSEYPDDRRMTEYKDIRNALYFYGLGDEWEEMMTNLFGDPCPLIGAPFAGLPDYEILRPAPAKGLNMKQKAGLIRVAVSRVSNYSGAW